MWTECDFPKCKQPAEMGYIGRDLCDGHWAMLCEADPKAEKKLLKKIGLVRDETGAVVSEISFDK